MFLVLNKKVSTHSRYSAKRNEWAILPKVYQYGIYFRLVWVEPYLYALGGATFASKIYSNTMDICRYNHTELIKSRTSICKQIISFTLK